MHSAETPQLEISVSFPPLNVPADWPPQPDPHTSESEPTGLLRHPLLLLLLIVLMPGGMPLLLWYEYSILESISAPFRLLVIIASYFVPLLVVFSLIDASHERIRARYRYISDPIEVELNARPVVCGWRGDPIEDAILVALADAVGLEKYLPHSPALHPKDSLRYLLWGAFDDITPLVFRTNFDKRFKCDPVAAVLEGVEKDWNVEEFVAACIHLIADKTVSLRASQPTD